MTESSEIKFLHYRYSDADGNVFARGGLTIAYREIPGGKIQHASAKCHLNDNFVKQAGRAKAGGRLQSPRYAQVFDGDEGKFADALETDIAYFNRNAYLYNPEGVNLTLVRKYNGKRKTKSEYGLLGA